MSSVWLQAVLRVQKFSQNWNFRFECNIWPLTKLCCGSYRSLTYLCIFKSKFLDKFSCVFGLIYENFITLLLDLESKKVVGLSHHRHFELFLHAWFKILTKHLIRRSKNDIININLHNKDITINMLCKNVMSILPFTKSFEIRK